ncbi:MAG: hypothetical protein Q4C53_05780 [Clostridia bacterium]|nr:hypothetical protein [Clostridia bacterium]
MAKRPASFNKYPELSADATQKMLDNVFDAARVKRNTTPLPKLALYSEYRRERFGTQRRLTFALLIVFLILPLCFFAPKITVEQMPQGNDRLPKYRISVESLLPVHRVAASVGDTGFPVYESGTKTYVVQPTRNGDLDIEVMLLNRQWDIVTVPVAGVDAEPPHILEDYFKGGQLILVVADDNSGVDFSAIHTKDAAGNTALPLTTDPASGEVRFPFPEETITIFIPDNAGNTLQLVLKPVEGE